jgi:hypothetical protein
MADLGAFVHDWGYPKAKKTLVWDAVDPSLKQFSLGKSVMATLTGFEPVFPP